MKTRSRYLCPLEWTHDMIKGKWKPVILWRLREGPLSFSDLRKAIDGITDKMLLQHIGELVDNGFVSKDKYNGYPLKVEYSLNADYGVKMIQALQVMHSIGVEHFSAQYLTLLPEAKDDTPHNARIEDIEFKKTG